MLPDYIAKASPNPASNRAPWYTNTAPSYAGIFLWVVFYMQIAGGTLDKAGVGLCMLALLVAGLLSYFFFYRAPAMLGMQTGYPLYVVGSSTFGTKGGYLMPGLLMGALQAGWVSVNIFVSTTFIFSGLGTKSGPGSVPFTIVAILWGFGMSYIGVKGIKYVARFSTYLSVIPLLMILFVFFKTSGGIGQYIPPDPKPYIGFMMLIQIVIGFFATAGAAGADFGMNSRNSSDVKWGGLVGVTLAVLIAGGLPILSIAGAHGMGMTQGYTYDAVISGIGGGLGTAMFFLFALASIAPCLLLRIHRGQQLRHDDSGRIAHGFDDGGRGGGGVAGGHGRGGEPGRPVHRYRGVLRTNLRGHGRRLPAIREEVGRTAGRHQLGRLHCLGSRIHRGHFAVPAVLGPGDDGLFAAGRGLQLHSGLRRVRDSG